MCVSLSALWTNLYLFHEHTHWVQALAPNTKRYSRINHTHRPLWQGWPRAHNKGKGSCGSSASPLCQSVEHAPMTLINVARWAAARNHCCQTHRTRSQELYTRKQFWQTELTPGSNAYSCANWAPVLFPGSRIPISWSKNMPTVLGGH